MRYFLSLIRENLLSAGMLFLLIAMLITLWSDKKHLWMWLFPFFIVAGLLAGRFSLTALCPVATLGICLYLYNKENLSTFIRVPCNIIFFVTSFSLITHLFPGFTNWKVVSNEIISTDAIPVNLYFNFDKAIVGIFSLAILFRNHHSIIWKDIIKKAPLWTGIAILFMIPLSFLLGYVRWDPKLSPFMLTWIIANFLTCITEEAFFRGLVQGRLTSLLGNYRWGKFLGLAIASILFGILHYPGGIKYILLATVAGFIYGSAYMKTKNIETAIFTHFFLNVVHFVWFTYPALTYAFISN